MGSTALKLARGPPEFLLTEMSPCVYSSPQSVMGARLSWTACLACSLYHVHHTRAYFCSGGCWLYQQQSSLCNFWHSVYCCPREPVCKENGRSPATPVLKGVPVHKSFVDQGLNVQHQTELLWVLHSPRLDLCLWEYFRSTCCAGLSAKILLCFCAPRV